ncbi:Hypothetical protein AA314_06799 [Archangium gephyra]|uniref:Uncharacterized protein n=1 Tax=Archangium gephyra TaxID=48 RepID=A0AAC8TGI5_9BACT|nr:Hypothetical protein AA314_06799 [Archangium gephyra]
MVPHAGLRSSSWFHHARPAVERAGPGVFDPGTALSTTGQFPGEASGSFE